MNIIEASKLVEATDIIGKVALLSGVHGIGKSEIVRQYADKKGLYSEIVMMSLMDTGDLCGIPVTADIGGQISTVWAAPVWFNNLVNRAWPNKLKKSGLQFNDKDFEKEVISKLEDIVCRSSFNQMYCSYYNLPNDSLRLHYQDNVYYTLGQRSVLFLDEFNRAPADVLNASLQLILDKKLNSHILPRVCGKDTLVVAAVNPSDSNYTTMELDPALMDRFVYGTVEADIKSFLAYGNQINLHPVISGFLAQSPKHLHNCRADGQGSTPRSWVHLSTFLHNLDSMPENILTTYIIGVLGDVVAAEFIVYYNNHSKALSADTIIDEVTKKAKRTTDVDKLTPSIIKLIENQEPLQLQELCTKLEEKLINENVTTALPYIVYLHSLPNEALATYIQQAKANDKIYTNLIALDNHWTGKKLFKKLLAFGK